MHNANLSIAKRASYEIYFSFESNMTTTGKDLTVSHHTLILHLSLSLPPLTLTLSSFVEFVMEMKVRKKEIPK